MSRTTLRRIAAGTALCGVVAAALAVPLGAFAQQNDRGGMLFKLRLAERFMTRNTTSPDPDVDGTRSALTTDVDLSFSSETRTETATLDFNSGYRFVDDETTDGYEGEWADPRLTFSYSQVAASARMRVTAFASSVSLSEVSPLDAPSAEGESVPVDFAELTDSGTRQQLGFDARLALRTDAPFGMIFGLGMNDISYTDLPAGSTLRDRSSLRLTATGRFDVTKVLQVRSGLQYDLVDKDGEDEIQRVGLNGQAILTTPDGNYRLSGNLAGGDGGEKTAFRVGRRYELAQTVLDGDIGFTLASDSFFVTGSAALEYEFGPESALGSVTATADRDINFAGASGDEVVTSLALASSYALTPLANVSLSAQLAQSEKIDTGDTVDLAKAGLSVSYDFDQNWRANAGVSADWRDPSDASATESTTLSLGVTRSFDLRR